MSTHEPIAYVDGINCEILCAEHGAERDADIARNCAEHGDHENHDECHLTALFSWNSDELAAVEYCADGHSFCGSCGSYMDMTRGSQDADVNGHFARCWNCGDESVYVDGLGYSWAGRWTDALNTHKVQVYGATVTYQTDLNGYTDVSDVLDESTGAMRKFEASAAYVEGSPGLGTVLVLADSWEDAFAAACDHFIDESEPVPYEPADVECLQVATNQVWFTTK